jgi:hypothetical protein
MVMREDWQVSEDSARAISLSGQESVPRLSGTQVTEQREDLLAMAGQIVPIVFTTKTSLNGFYRIDDASGDYTDWSAELRTFAWKCSVTRLGNESEVDIESRLSGSITRANNFSVIGERTHAPAIGHNAYWSDATVSSAVTRTAEDGSIKLYRGLGAAISPRWAITPTAYAGGRVRVLVSGRERAGTMFKCDPNGWELSNGLVRVRPNVKLEVSAYTGGSWKPKLWDTLNAATTLFPFDYAVVLDNRYESGTIRLTKSLATGRVYVDLTLRRGFRFVEVVIQAEFGATLKVARTTTEAGTNALGGTIVASANDADGNKYIVGSARTFTPDLNGGLSIAATPVLDAFIGVVAGGTGAITGDAAVDLQKQYIGAPSESIQAVRR